MNIEFLNQRIAIRNKEIDEGKNAGTRNPIYIVCTRNENFVEGFIQKARIKSEHSGHVGIEFSPTFSEIDSNVEFVHGYFDEGEDFESREFCESSEGMAKPIEVTKFESCMYRAFFLTSEAAHNYINYQAHNLNKPFVFVHYAGYRNWEFDNLMFDERH